MYPVVVSGAGRLRHGNRICAGVAFPWGPSRPFGTVCRRASEQPRFPATRQDASLVAAGAGAVGKGGGPAGAREREVDDGVGGGIERC